MPSCRSVLVLALAVTGVLAAPAGAAQVAYIDGDQVWVSTLDGTQKRSLSGPSPDEKQWREVTQADDGSILGNRREAGKMGQFNATELWGPDGTSRGTGTLTAKPGRTTYAFPVTLDLTPDAGTVVYGYANTSGFGLGQTFEFGTYAEASTNWFTEPFDVTPVDSGTLAGRRLVGKSGTTIMLQDDTGQPPYSTDFTTWFDAGGIDADISHVDVAATGTIVAVQVGDIGQQKIAMIPFASLGGPLPADGSDCFLPTQGDARDPSISQDGTMMAWKDDRGVVVAGTPVWFPSVAVSTCNLSSPPVVISPTGQMPSIGPSTAATPPAAPPPSGEAPPVAGGGAPPPPPPSGGTTPPTTSAAGPVATITRTLRAASLRTGVPITVTVGAAGPVTVVATVGGKVIARASGRARGAGKLRLRLKATKAGRKRLKKLRGKSLVIKVRAGGRTTTLRRKLR